MRAYSALDIRRHAARERQETIAWMRQRFPDERNWKELLHPRFAIERHGYEYEERGDLDLELRVVGSPKVWKRSVCSGLLDRGGKFVAVSERFSPEERRFTAGHELGHMNLHPDMEVAHRDRLTGRREKRPRREKEADLFAAYYLMPEKWVTSDVVEKFGRVPIVVNEHLAWWLDPDDHERFYEARFAKELAMAVAVCSTLGGPHFRSLKEEYAVSTEAMAKRLQELSLIDNRLARN